MMGYTPTAIPNNLSEITNSPPLSSYISDLNSIRKEAQAAHELAQQKINKHHSQNFTPFQVGQQVWLEATNIRIPNKPSKLTPKRFGPFTIIHKFSNLVYKLKLPPHWKIHPVFHASLLSPYIETELHGPNPKNPPPEIIEHQQCTLKALVHGSICSVLA